MENDARVLDLAAAVSDGSDIDWDRAEASAADEGERAVVMQLRRLAALKQAAKEQALTWGPLDIREEVGSGSFGTVYRAWDSRLEREVALKLLNGDASGSEAATTFLNEGRLLAKLRHPNVVTVHGADRHDGVVGIWMEFVSGRTLKELIQEHGPFGSYEAALIGRDLCRALTAVHQQGYLHRDIKAQNVMREAGGRIVLMDFGTGAALASDGVHALAGTPAYLAPELLGGEPASVLSDIYSLGVLLYHLVTDRFPVNARSLDEFRQRHAASERTLLRDARPDLNDGFVRAVDAALATRPEDRPKSGGALAHLLERSLDVLASSWSGAGEEIPATRPSIDSNLVRRRWIARAVAAAAVVAMAAMWQLRGSPLASRNSVAILPFATVGEISEGDYLMTGISQDIAAQLASLSELQIIAGASTLRYKDHSKSPVQIGRELGVAAVLDGTVQRIDNRLRVAVDLVDAASGARLWSEVFNRDVREIVSLQSEMSRKVAIALRGELSGVDVDRLKPSIGGDYETFSLYAKGRQQWSLRTEEGVNRSIQLFKQAIQRDSQFAPAYAGLSDAYTSLGSYGALPRAEAWKRAAETAQQAVSLDPSLAEAHASLGYAEKNRFQWQAAEASFKRALALKPGAPLLHHWYAILLTQLGRFPEAITEIKAAIALDPLSIGANLQFGSVLYMARRHEDAIAQWQRALQLDPSFVNGYRGIATAYAALGMYDRALDRVAEATRRSPAGADDHDLKTDVACILAAAGRRDEALRIAIGFIDRYHATGEGVAGSIAAVYAALGELDSSFKWLRLAVEDRNPEVGYLKVDPRWDSLRRDSRFDRLLTELSLSDTQ